MSDDINKAFIIGCRLAMSKFAQEQDKEVAHLTDILDSILSNKNNNGSSEPVLESSERASSSSWGDKMELETPKNTGINV